MSLGSTTLGLEKDQNVAERGKAWAILLIAAAAILALAGQIHWGVNTNTSWNITLAEKMLAGQRPNVDFFEINPPLSYLMYLPPTLLAKLIGASPESLAELFCFVGAGASLWLSGVILARGKLVGRAAQGAKLAAVGALVLLLLPAAAFTEREHIALLASLPCLASLAVLAAGRRTEVLLRALAGAGAGLAMAIKPHFALFFLPVVAYAERRAGWRALVRQIDPYVAIAVVALYWIAVAVFLPDFLERMAPIVRDIYVPARKPFSALFGDPAFLIWTAFAVLLVLIARKRLAEPLIAVPALSSLGAMAAYVAQGKYWPYQAYPALALAGLAIGPLVLENLSSLGAAPRPWIRLAVAELMVALLALAGFWLSLNNDQSELERAVAAIAPHPRLLAISPDIATGHPLTRRVHGVWVGSTFGVWMTQLSMRALERTQSGEDARKLEAYMRFDRERLVADIQDNKPDAILVADASWLAWAQSHPDVAAALADYHLRQTIGDTMVYTRADGASR